MSKRRRREHYVNVIRSSRGRWMIGYECPIDGEEHFDWFMPALRQWLADRAVSRPACVVCRRDVVDRQRPPQALLLIEVDVLPERPPSQVWFVDICDQCSSGSDEELRKLGLRNLFGRAGVPSRIGDYSIVGGVFGGSVFTVNDGSIHGGSLPMTMRREAQHAEPIAGKSKPEEDEDDLPLSAA